MTAYLVNNEVLTLVFGYLDTLELLNASSVCAAWKSASEHSWNTLCASYGCATKDEFRQKWRQEQIQFWTAHSLANQPEEYSLARQIRIAQTASEYQYLIRFSYPRFDGLAWNGIVPLQFVRPIALQAEDEEPSAVVGYRLQFDMKNLSFSTGKSSWERLFAVYFPFDKRKWDVLEEVRNDPDCPFRTAGFDLEDLYITIVAFRDDEFSTLVPCQNCVAQWKTSDNLECLPITYGGFISYLGNLRLTFMGQPGSARTGVTTFRLETMSLCIYGDSLHRFY